MTRDPSASSPAADFAYRTFRPDEETGVHRWDTAVAAECTVPLAGPPAGAKSWALALPVHASRATMLLVEVTLDCDATPAAAVACGYHTSFVVEWAGWNTLPFTLSSLTRIGEPTGPASIRRLRLKAVSATFAGTVLELGRATWPDDSPLVPVTPYEDMVVNFLSPRLWDRADWTHAGPALLPAGEESLDVAWMYANLRYLQKPGRRHQTAYTRRMNVDLTPYQAVTVFTATDLRANFSLILEIDGVAVRAIDQRRGLGGGDEIRAEIRGRRLTALTLELEQAETESHEALDVQVATSIRWILLERTGTDPAQIGQAWGIPAIPPPDRVEPLETGILPVGLMIGREEFLRLRDEAKRGGRRRQLADEILAEAATHLDYHPERYAGRYLPVDLGNQGCERRVSPWDQMYDVNSCMVYSALAYALTGDLRHGQAARRGLFTALRCTTWQGGFPSRIPAGLPGYRAPFIESATSESVAVCYDFIYPLLSDAERREVEDGLYEKGLPWIDMYLRYYGEGYLLNSNQGAVYVAGLVFAALVARRSHPDVDAVLERTLQWFPRMLNNYFKATGATNEGPGYWEYTADNTVTALLAIARHRGGAVRDHAPAHLGKTIDYILHLRSLARTRLSFLPLGDNIERIGFAFMNSSLLFFARHYDDPHALWLWRKFFADRANPPGSDFFGKRMTGAYALSGLKEFILHVDGDPAPPKLPPAHRFEGCDRVTLRTGSEHGDLLFLFEGGPQTFDHTHNDKGQFILEAFGERLAADPGVIKYQDPAHVFYKGTPYHNLVTHRGREQAYRDAAHAVVLNELSCGGPCDFLDADLRNSYRSLSRYRRRIVFVRPHYFLVLDDVVADEPGLEWNFHSGVPIRSLDLAAGLVRFEGESAGLVLALGCLEPLTAATGEYAADGTVLSHNLVLSTPTPSATLTLAALLVPYPRTRGVPEVRVHRAQGAVEFELSHADGTDRVCCGFQTGSEPVITVARKTANKETVIFNR